MDDSAVKKTTGKKLNHWFSCIKKEGMENSAHKEIAAFLREQKNISSWWAQQITVLFEKQSGRRVTGQTVDSGFQIGVTKTINTDVRKVWEYAVSKEGMYLLTGDRINAGNVIEQNRTGENGIEYCITTFRPRTHWRMKWRKPEWPSHSIVQVRVYTGSSGKAVMAIHQEKLRRPEDRQEMKAWWKHTVTCVAAVLE